MNVSITLTINGERKTVTTDPNRLLLEVLREDLHLTGTKYGCGQSRCGACMVLLDGITVRSCATRIADAKNKSVITIEGLARDNQLHPMQQAFLDEGAIQCGYCTPGMVLRAVALLEKDPDPSEAAIKAWMDGNVCRCNGYVKIIKAIRRAARHMEGARI
ncbi:MAG: (2Fe-2S)-binding protein [Phycisphaeraceae bacterium]|nr:(2Fe-2S)-binding protein [Phycisphaeraceae bacterium]